MVNKLPCLYGFISETSTGNRNENLFKAINHLRRYNQNATIDEITQEALSINKAFHSPLSEQEVTVVCKHVLAKNYRTSCWKFKHYCKHCRYGKFRKLFRNSKPGYWKHINENNRLIGIRTIADDEYYPWDILDTSKLNQKERSSIQQFREEMGIPIAIDVIVKSYGIPVGDKAKREWERFRKNEVR
jgi:hypothetical protein